jgi:hypothetical protein
LTTEGGVVTLEELTGRAVSCVGLVWITGFSVLLEHAAKQNKEVANTKGIVYFIIEVVKKRATSPAARNV